MNCAECDDKECSRGKDCAGLAGEILPGYGEPETKLVHDAAATTYYLSGTRKLISLL